MIDAAKIVRSPIVRAVLGSTADRAAASSGTSTRRVGVLKNSRSA